MGSFRVEYEHGRVSKTYQSFEEARSAKAVEYLWSGRIGEIQERSDDGWVRTEDQRILRKSEGVGW